MIDSVSDTGAAADLKKARRRKASSSATVDRLPPHSHESEQGVLGCILLAPNESFGELVSKIKTPEVFYDLRHQTIYSVMLEMYEARNPIDLITVMTRLKEKQLLEQIGGIAYLSQLQDAVPSAANLSYYLDIVREKYLLRKMISVCSEVVGRVHDYEGDVDALLDEVERDVLAIRPKENQAVIPVKELVSQSIKHIEERFELQGKCGGIPTGFADLDYMTDGLHNGELIILSGYDSRKKDSSSLGKTALAMNIVENVLFESKLPVGVLTGEMTPRQLTDRMIASMSRVNLRSLNRGWLTESDFPKMTSAASRLSNSKLHIENASGSSIMELRATARRMYQQHGIKFFVADYLQLFSSPSSRKDGNREQEISDIAKGFFDLSKELNVPILLISQTNEQGFIRESRATRHHTDCHWQLQPVSDSDDSDSVAVNLLIDKNRNGESGKFVNLTFLKPFTRFESAAKISDDDIPNG